MTTFVSTVRDRGVCPPPPVFASVWEDARELELGMALPGTEFILQSHIAERRAADVYGTVDPVTGAPMALKVLRPNTDALTRHCFMDEICLTRRIDSGRVIEVLEASWTPGGRPWYAMPRPCETSLRDLLRLRGELSLGRVLRILERAARAVADVHAAEVVHRDIKPSNLMVVSEGHDDDVVLIDFGIACELGRTPIHHSGTPRYMPPEQADDAPATAATDIYALGCCAYEMLMGGGLSNASTIDGVRRAARTRRIRAVARWPGNRNGRTPRWLRTIVDRCLRRDPADRFGSAKELADALHRGGVVATRRLVRVPARSRCV